jgi:hypothetical protein
MPYKAWRPTCSCRNGYSPTETVCPDCGKKTKCEGWRYSMYEAMARQQTVYGLKPIGPHRRMVDELFQGALKGCDRCGGSGLLDRDGGASWEKCGGCGGLGRTLAISPEEFEAIRQKVLEAYPEQGAPRVQGFAGGVILQNLSTGTMEVYPRDPD